jgi:hypothetical protein
VGVRTDVFVSTPGGVPSIAVPPGFVPGGSHGYPLGTPA